ncbi:V-type proton ATPase 116 kDa subunit a [Ceratitis capitata]|uniref:V-type proton ATPase subunit a n=1 Tax=Ceratitis capitata TaxID=7213 RepID=W8BJ58_CERCA|nr:V-type proton ATPase 116 kDa subunit a [Ceratitis capitata]XP_012154939.1 V-type proton ATPase 116 kDa subunit a [Ceratitis capitata]XP_020712854.1 V-type proton ATPase 116 kDa subunit a [Ceratitis capitata]XP_023159332.1 V-type proton ATPase 116 kDa subunit a [Ceratitis capitata]
MGDMFRSESMALCQMFIQPEAAYSTMAELGESGCVQFRDLNAQVSAFQRKFVSEVKRCSELERKIRYIENELRKDDIKMPEVLDEPQPPYPREIIDLEAQLETIETEIRELSISKVSLNANHQGLIELELVLENANEFFSETEIVNLSSRRFSVVEEVAQIGQQRGELGFVAGIISLERFFSFERILWRISMGNIFVKRSDLKEQLLEAQTEKLETKTIFVAFFQGDQLKQRIKKVCAGYHAAVYPCPSAYAERQRMLEDVRMRLADLTLVLNQTADHRNRVLVAAAKHLPTWTIMVKKMKAIYHTLNLFNVDLSNKCLIGEGWVPTSDLPVVRDALARGSAKVESTVPSFMNIIETNEQPPTYNRTNKFTRGFQNLIDAYGLGSYREVNPALYTCITFPFLFAVMFGDLGHGLIVLLVALYMTFNERKLSEIKSEIFSIFFSGRYIILFMGFFSVYTGFVYNDIFSKSMNIFGSSWKVNYNTTTALNNTELTLNPYYDQDGVYPYGMDPVWILAENNIIFLNTYKMKLSIIFGLAHMVFGIFMSFINFVHFRKYSHIFLEFVPQLIFLLLLFGYLVFMMFFKWVKYSGRATEDALKPGCAPSILILFINMMLFGHTEPKDGCEEYMFEGQRVLQIAFVVLAVLCIPWMLLGTPLYEKLKRNKRAIAQNGDIHDSTLPNGTAVHQKVGDSGHGDEEEPLSEVFIKQAIHTIEYVLSTISHTASYLRLWALSLAHAQLSEVLWMMVMRRGFLLPVIFGGPILLYVCFAAWAFFTLAILVVIEGLSAFLHTLRLHWVEFMSKFYEGSGYAFQPFSFKAILESSYED